MAGKPPVVLTPEQKQLALDLALQGRSLKDIRKEIGIAESALYHLKDPEFLNSFSRARQEALEDLADTLLTVAHEVEDVQRARVHSENIKWILSKRKPEVYGDRIDLNINQTVDIGTALLDARNRALLPPSQARDVIEVSPDISTDSQSVPAETKDANDKKDDDIFS